MLSLMPQRRQIRANCDSGFPSHVCDASSFESESNDESESSSSASDTKLVQQQQRWWLRSIFRKKQETKTWNEAEKQTSKLRPTLFSEDWNHNDGSSLMFLQDALEFGRFSASQDLADYVGGSDDESIPSTYDRHICPSILVRKLSALTDDGDIHFRDSADWEDPSVQSKREDSFLGEQPVLPKTTSQKDFVVRMRQTVLTPFIANASPSWRGISLPISPRVFPWRQASALLRPTKETEDPSKP